MVVNRYLLILTCLVFIINAQTIARTSSLQSVKTISFNKEKLTQVGAATSSTCFSKSATLIYKCPGTDVCTSNYQFCQYIESVCTQASLPFRCFSGESKCAANMTAECCPTGQFFCSHTRACVTTTAQCCSLNSLTPIYCKLSETCVSHAHQCCSNYLANKIAMIKCTNEDKCVPTNSQVQCFTPVAKNCTSSEFPIYCKQDATCKRTVLECSSPVVCPPGYFQCPDQSCIAGSDMISGCKTLTTCQKSLPVINSTISLSFARCADTKTCLSDLNDCPTMKSCFGGVVCPDKSCKQTAYQCLEPQVYYGYEKLTSCGKSMLRCPNGQCAYSCENDMTVPNCTALGKVYCGNENRCASSNDECDEPIYCPLVSNFTYAPDTIICGNGVQTCVTDFSDCYSTSLKTKQNAMDTAQGINILGLKGATLNQKTIFTCTDGRTALKPEYCATPFSCSNTFAKVGGFGQFCLANAVTSRQGVENYIKNRQNSCAKGLLHCLDGSCRENIFDCPQEISCPAEYPFACQDGSCVDNVDIYCGKADTGILANLKICLDQGLLLCHSDMWTCTNTYANCATISTCPVGYVKCSETNCINPSTQSCPPFSGNPCTSILNPYYCRFTQTCMSSFQSCASVVCPLDTPVMCAQDRSCQISSKQCKTPEQLIQELSKSVIKTNILTNNKQIDAVLKVVLETPVICQNGQFICQNGCSNTACTEWLVCPDGQVKCWNGYCSTNVDYCPNQATGCPFYLPIRCPYSAKCVKLTADCGSETQAQQDLQVVCATQNTKTPCKLEGNCKSNSTQCVTTFTPSCTDYLFPNTIKKTTTGLLSATCYVPSCPTAYPYKCQNGLCVNDSVNCASTPFSLLEYQNCFNMTASLGINVQVPCGDGTCVKNHNQCSPLYDCALNPVNTVRCPDGSCRAWNSDCPSLAKTCPTQMSFRCPTGQCVRKQEECIQNSNGCPTNLPLRCIYTGVCMADLFYCYSPSQMFNYLSLQPPWYKTSLCQRLNKIPCYSKGQLFYCASSASDCIKPGNGCPSDMPILCEANNLCVANYLLCAQTKPTSFVALTVTNENLCPSTAPFRCNYLDKNACQVLPYSSYYEIENNSCKYRIDLLEQLYVMNECVGAITPWSCGDGSCVKDYTQCKTCPYFCAKIMKCLATQYDCDWYSLNTANQHEIDHLCPSGTPVLCIVDGRCVQDVQECIESENHLSGVYSGMLLDESCASSTPIRCISGQCVDIYQKCLSGALTGQVFSFPIAWTTSVLTSTATAKPCQVYCSDGSCRDRQQNCPLIRPCSNPLKPYRCISGFCAQDKDACISMYGSITEKEELGVPSLSCLLLTGSQVMQFRCEDGTCRPGYLDSVSNTYKTSCLSYFGCPLTKAYQCQTGQCVNKESDCLQYSKNCKNKYQCKNQQCVSSPSECSLSATAIEPLQIRFDYNPFTAASIDFAFIGNDPIARMSLQPNSFKVDSKSITTRIAYQKLVFSPVPQSIKDSITNEVNPQMYKYLKDKVDISKEGLISSFDSVLTPLVLIEDYNCTNSELLSGVMLEYKLDFFTWPSTLDQNTDICLAFEVDGKWLCESREFSTTSDGFMAFNITKIGGIYSLIVSPNSSRLHCGFGCWYKTHKALFWWIMGALILLLILLLVILMIFLMCTNKRPAEKPAYKTPLAQERTTIKSSFNENVKTTTEQSEKQKKSTEFKRQKGIEDVMADKTREIYELEKRLQQMENKFASMTSQTSYGTTKSGIKKKKTKLENELNGLQKDLLASDDVHENITDYTTEKSYPVKTQTSVTKQAEKKDKNQRMEKKTLTSMNSQRSDFEEWKIWKKNRKNYVPTDSDDDRNYSAPQKNAKQTSAKPLKQSMNSQRSNDNRKSYVPTNEDDDNDPISSFPVPVFERTLTRQKRASQVETKQKPILKQSQNFTLQDSDPEENNNALDEQWNYFANDYLLEERYQQVDSPKHDFNSEPQKKKKGVSYNTQPQNPEKKNKGLFADTRQKAREGLNMLGAHDGIHGSKTGKQVQLNSIDEDAKKSYNRTAQNARKEKANANLGQSYGKEISQKKEKPQSNVTNPKKQQSSKQEQPTNKKVQQVWDSIMSDSESDY